MFQTINMLINVTSNIHVDKD